MMHIMYFFIMVMSKCIHTKFKQDYSHYLKPLSKHPDFLQKILKVIASELQKKKGYYCGRYFLPSKFTETSALKFPKHFN